MNSRKPVKIDEDMKRLNRIGVLTAAKLLAVLMGMLGLLAGILYSIGGAVYDLAATGSFNQGTALAFLALIGMPVLFGAAGFILGALWTYLYNLAAGWVGGIEIDIENNPE